MSADGVPSATDPFGSVIAEMTLAGDPDLAVRAALSTFEPRPAALWLTWRGGQMVGEAITDGLAKPEVAELAAVWEAGRSSPAAPLGRFVGVGLPRNGAGAFDGEPAASMLVLVFADSSESELFASRAAAAPGLQLAGRLLAQQRELAIDQRIATHTRDILFSSQSADPADTCGRVAEALRDVTRLDGHCTVLRVQRPFDGTSGADCTLEVVTRLSGESPSGAVGPGRYGGGPPGVPWSQEQWARLTDKSGRSLFSSRLRQSGSGSLVLQIDSYEVVEGADRLVARPRAVEGVGRQSYEADQPISTIRAVLRGLAGNDLLGPGSAVVVPLFEADELLGFVIVSCPRERAFSDGDMVRIWQLGLLGVRPLARMRQLERDLGLTSLVLSEATELIGTPPPLNNRHAKSALGIVCERLRRVLQADSVALLPYDHKQDALVEGGVVNAGKWADVPRSRHPSPGGIIHAVLHAESGTFEWSVKPADQFEPGSFVARHDIGRLCARALRSTSGAAVGVLICNWARTPGQPAPAASRAAGPGEESAELRLMAPVARMVARFLERQTESSSLARTHTTLFDVYSTLLTESSSVFAEGVGSAQGVRNQLLEQILGSAIEIVGGTTGVFVLPSSEHEGMDNLIVRGANRGPARIAFGEGTTGACALTRQMVVIPDSTNPETYPGGVQPLRSRVPSSRSEMAYPVEDSQGRLLGVIDLENEIATGAFVEVDAAPVLQPLAQAATLVIQVTDSVAHLASVARLSQVLDDALGLSEEEIARAVLEEVRQVTGAFAGGARVPDQLGEVLIPLAQDGASGPRIGDRFALDPQSPYGIVHLRGERVYIDDVRRLRVGLKRPYAGYVPSRRETRSKIFLPVRHHAQTIGVLDFDHRQPDAFRVHERYLQVVAGQFGHALAASRDSQRRLVRKSVDMVNVLNAYYARINHLIAGRFNAIGQKLRELESRHAGSGLALGDDLRNIYAIAAQGVHDADELLVAAAGNFEDVRDVDVRHVLLSALPQDRRDRFDLEIGVGDPVWVLAREQMLRWVFREIVANSLKYCGEEVNISVSLSVDALKSRAVVVLQDDGPGMQQEELADLFTLRGRDASREGHGAGLAMVGARAFLETMRGTIGADTVSPHGLRVTITLPMLRGGVRA